MALETGLLPLLGAVSLAMVRIVAGDAAHLVALLEALALSQVLVLIGDVFLFGIPAVKRLEVLIQRLAGDVRERLGAVLGGIAVALSADSHLPFPIEMTW